MQATKKSQNNFEKHNVAGLTCDNLVHMKTVQSNNQDSVVQTSGQTYR